jgi:copper chaperone NosL
MSYQPPLIGTKQLLNFHAASWPDIAGWLAILAVGLVLGVTVLEWKRADAVRQRPAMHAQPAREVVA